ncbi:MAG: endonuclease/exonuclease/phosphatase family protein [Planctomycetota bacterium]
MPHAAKFTYGTKLVLRGTLGAKILDPETCFGREAEVGIFSKRRRKSRHSSSNPLLRWFGPGFTVAGLLYVGYSVLSGNWTFSSLDESDPSLIRPTPVSLGEQSDRPADRIRIATFNIEKFGETKSTKRESEGGIDVLAKLAQIVSQFDLIAIQEVMGQDGKSVQRLVALLNASGKTYDFYLSEPIGLENNNYRESYAFVWDRNRIEIAPGRSYVVRDPGKRMHREPMVATFQTRVPAQSPREPFRFTVINVHTDPDEVDPNNPNSEINVLADVFHRVREYEYEGFRETDFILLGDLNAGPNGLGGLTAMGLFSIAGDIKTNVNRTKTKDHILIDRSVTTEYTESMGVIDFKQDLKLTEQQAEEVSDHLPLWAEFDIYEQGTPQLTSSETGRELK